ncbi:AfsR/SARP family transcriptional regulator [Amycolatopsis silviterrae]|uniref:BTAD domain-containing putative transcriptional regulator n=1 Tax=Amycolatopsis silviterrae TaxID=1656914 RepID=A0ABW5HHA1_9PSEU
MRFYVLGGLRITNGKESYLPTAPKQRQLVALLLLNANKPVSTETCMSELWEGRPPRTWAQTLQTYVLQIRRTLAADPDLGSLSAARKHLATIARGYAMVVPPETFDLERFRESAARARAARQARDDLLVSQRSREALAAWNGPALSDVDLGPILRGQVRSLEEARASTAEQCYEAELRLGYHRELLSELGAAAAQDPMNENLQALFMLALYRSGRQVQALEVFRRLRTDLAGELGLTPSARISRLHEAILRMDPELDDQSRQQPALIPSFASQP